jgi:hypothetical protein
MNLLTRALIALATGIAEPYVEIAWRCRTGLETSEACVWGRALLPLGRWVAPLLVAPVVFVALTGMTWAWGRWRQRVPK